MAATSTGRTVCSSVFGLTHENLSPLVSGECIGARTLGLLVKSRVIVTDNVLFAQVDELFVAAMH